MWYQSIPEISVDKMNQFTPSTIIAALLCAFAVGTTAQGKEGKIYSCILLMGFDIIDLRYLNCLLSPNAEQAFWSLQSTKNPFGFLDMIPIVKKTLIIVIFCIQAIPDIFDQIVVYLGF